MQALALMPFKNDFTNIFDAMTRACEAYSRTPAAQNAPRPAALQCIRVDKNPQSLDIMKDLVTLIRKCTLCIVDISGPNQNVMWELGYAMALDKPLVILTQNRNDIGFDLRGYRNIEYSPNNLTALETSLTSELSKLMDSLPDPVVNELESSRSQTLAMTTASATYFLSPDFRIVYMNDAAVTLFELDNAAYWLDRPLSEFVNEMSDRIDNIMEVERNLQEQLATIERIQDAGQPAMIPLHNVETIVLSTKAYGKVELQKTGVAVRDNTKDSATSDIVGWVVSFNVVEAAEPKLFREFHKVHKRDRRPVIPARRS